MQQTQKNASIKIHVSGKSLSCEKPETSWALLAHISSRTEISKTFFETSVANGMRDETHILLTLIPGEKITSTLDELTMDGRKIINRSAVEHLHSRIPELSETLPL